MRVLAFPCGSEVALEVHRSLCYVRDIELWGASSVDDHGRFVYEHYIGNVPTVYEENFLTEFKKIIEEYKIEVVFPCMDIVIPVLKKNEDYLGCKVVSAPYATTEICLSKRKTYEFLKDVVTVPKQYGRTDAIAYPVFLKPEVGASSRHVFKAESERDLDFYLSKYPHHMILEYLPGDEYTVDCFTDRHKELKFVGGRVRSRVSNGISVSCNSVKDEQISAIAHRINEALDMNGAWFFQLKKNAQGEYCLLEVAARFGGSSLVQRFQGVNFAHLSLLNILGIDVSILTNDIKIEADRSLDIKCKVSIEYDTVYVDFDDTLICADRVNLDIVKALYHFINLRKKLVLITKHAYDIHESLSRFKLTGIFDEVIHLQKTAEKSDYILSSSILIDDSYSERKKVKERNNIPVFTADAVMCLL